MKYQNINILSTDINNLQKFVNVALHTATADGDLCYDKLSDLLEVGSVFEPLIFKMNPKSTLEEFRTGCEEVWLALEKSSDPKLLNSLVIFS